MDLLAILKQRDGFELLELFDAALDLFGFGGFVSEFFDKGLFFGDEMSLLFRCFFELFFKSVTQFEVMVVIAWKEEKPVIVERGDGIDDVIKKSAVVADDEKCSRIAGQKIFEPCERGHVEVVCRFVEKKQIVFCEQEFCEQDAHLPTAGEFGCQL